MPDPDAQGPVKEEEIFQAAAELRGQERVAFLLTACGSQSGLRERVERLLESHDENSFMSRVADRTGMKAQGAARKHLNPEDGGNQIGHYKLLQQIGEGGCGIVYMAQQEDPVRRSVALKIIRPGMDTRSVIARFQQERQALAMMNHPNIAKVFDAGTTDTGRPFFVMELVHGLKITEYCDQNQLSTGERISLFVQVCHAVQHAHQKGIIHRDIKPSNILVTLHDVLPVPKVIDFGIAKAINGQRLTNETLFTAFQQFMGTPAYISPEQAEMSGLDIDTRSDIYSLGVLLYELLTGQTPFDGKHLVALGIDEMRKMIREKEPDRPSTRLTQELVAQGVNPVRSTIGLAIPTEAEVSAGLRRRLRLKEQINRLRGDLDWIVMKCLEKDRSRRYETANGLAADLKRHLNNEPVVARPPSAAYRFQKAWRRNKLAFAAAASIATALLLGIILSTWQAFEASRARDAEKKQWLAALTDRDRARTAQQEAEKAGQAEKQARLRADAEVYVADMNLAGQAWEQGNYLKLQQLLAATRNSPDRGFEWYYWQRQAHLSLQTFRGHRGHVNSVAFSPNGQRIVTGSGDQTARVWDASNGQELFKLQHKSWVNSVAFSTDGQHIVTGSQDGIARVWDATSHQELFSLIGHNDAILCVAFSSDGRRIATGSCDHTTRVWDAVTGKELIKLEEHSDSINSVAFSPDGKQILTGSADTTARLWDAATGRKILQIEVGWGAVYSVAFSPDNRRIATGSFLLTAQVWDAATGRELLKITDRGPISCVAFSSDSQRIVTGSWNSTATIWNAANGDKLLALRGHSKGLHAVAFSPDSERIVTASGDQTAKVWEARADQEPLLFRTKTPDVLAVAISPDGQRLAIGGGNFSENGTVTGTNQMAEVWELASRKKLFTLNGHSAGVSSVVFSPDGQRIVTGSGDRTAIVWNAATGLQEHKLEGHDGPVNAVAFSPDSLRIVSGGKDRIARVWDAATGKQLFTLVGHSAQVRAVTFCPDGRRIVSAGEDSTVRVWDAGTGGQVRLFQSTNMSIILSVAISPDGQRMVASGWPNVAIVWDFASGRELLVLAGHISPVCAAIFSPNGRRIVTGSYDSSGKVWDAASGRELLTLDCSREGVSSAAFSPDGRRIVIGSPSLGNGTVRNWEAAGLEQVAAWEAE